MSSLNGIRLYLLIFLPLIVSVLSINTLFAQQEDLLVLDNWIKFRDHDNALYHHLSEQAKKYLDKRLLEIKSISTSDEWKERQSQIRETLLQVVGPFPPKTRLHAIIVDTIIKEGFKVEKIVFESRPHFYVTACLYLPEKIEKKRPAIIYCSGHSDIGFRNGPYQLVILNLVKKGFIVFAFDPVGQGERIQHYDVDFAESKIGLPTVEHSYPGAQCFLTGSSLANYIIWDGIRAVDYLLSREEVDIERIGITGRSGGGTQAAYIAAFDKRILAVAPECYTTSFERLLESMGPCDAEQNFYHGIASGIDFADLYEVRAPFPTLIITTTRDIFSIQGARETTMEIKKMYRSFGKEKNIRQIEDDDIHASTVNNREKTYAFFQKFLNLPGSPDEEKVSYLTREELQITSTGQVCTSLGSETVFNLNAEFANRQIKNSVAKEKNILLHIQTTRQIAGDISGYQVPEKGSNPVFTGRLKRDGYSIEKYFIQGEGKYVIPYLLFKPVGEGPFPVIIYLHPGDKGTEAHPGGEIEWFVRKGWMVVAPDLLGQGEAGPGSYKGDAYDFKPGRVSYNLWFLAIQIKRSLTGIQAGDVNRLIDCIKNRQDVNTHQISALAKGEKCPVITHAAVFNPDINKIVLFEPLATFRMLVTHQYYKPRFIPSSVAGSIGQYDLPDLYAALAPRPLLLINVVDQIGQRLGEKDIETDFSIVYKTYRKLNMPDRFKIRQKEAYQALDDVLDDWLTN